MLNGFLGASVGIGVFIIIWVCLFTFEKYFQKKKKQTQELIINKEPVISQEIINIAESSNTWEMKLYKNFTIFENPHNEFQYMYFISGNLNWHLNASFSSLLTEDETLYLEDKISINLKKIITSPKLPKLDITKSKKEE